jgi:hypothetical protein
MSVGVVLSELTWVVPTGLSRPSRCCFVLVLLTVAVEVTVSPRRASLMVTPALMEDEDGHYCNTTLKWSVLYSTVL